MARARNLKPSFFTNEQLADQSPLGRLLFAGLWTLADFKGDLEWKARTIKVQLLPFDECDIKQLAINLDKSGLVRFYSVGDKVFVNIPNFEKHQNPHKNEKEKGSEIPAFSDKARQLIDLITLTIIPEKSGVVPSKNGSHPASSSLPLPDPLNLTPCTPARTAGELFEELWELFPNDLGNKGNKQNALREFTKLNPDEKQFAEILDGLRRHVQDKTLKKRAGVFWESFKHVERWIKSNSWKDEVSRSEQRNQYSRPLQGDKAESAAEYAFGPDAGTNTILEGSFDRVDTNETPH
jgi:hypothetical protein